ncbi:hypothetical protein GCM10017687_90810 [Streptomyces echinatus]
MPTGLVLRRPDGQTVVAHRRHPGTVTVTGEPSELLMFAYGRAGRGRGWIMDGDCGRDHPAARVPGSWASERRARAVGRGPSAGSVRRRRQGRHGARTDDPAECADGQALTA